MSGSFSENGTCVASLGVSFEVSGLRMGASISLMNLKRYEVMHEGVAGVVLSCRLSLQAVARCRLSGREKRAEGHCVVSCERAMSLSVLHTHSNTKQEEKHAPNIHRHRHPLRFSLLTDQQLRVKVAAPAVRSSPRASGPSACALRTSWRTVAP